MKNVLIDTDVILDFFFDREPFSENAAQVLSLCERKIVIGYLTPVILSNVYYLLSQKGKQEKAIEKLKALVSF
jgi:predicted nucleic acid-binding protein